MSKKIIVMYVQMDENNNQQWVSLWKFQKFVESTNLRLVMQDFFQFELWSLLVLVFLFILFLLGLEWHTVSHIGLLLIMS